MSTPDNADERTLDFSGFAALFDDLEKHEENIRVALSRFSSLHGSDEPLSSTPLGSPVRNIETPHVTPFGSPKRNIAIESSQCTNQPRSNSEPSLTADINLAVSCLPVTSATSLQYIYLDNKPIAVTRTMAPTVGQKKT